MGTAVMLINTVILFWAAYLFSLELAILTFVSIYITAVVTNKVVLGTKQRKAVMIISNKAYEISRHLMKQVGRGVTYLHGQGGYTMEDREVIYTAVKLTEVSKVKAIVNRIDPQAFMTISDASEVEGQGFTIPLDPPEPHYPA